MESYLAILFFIAPGFISRNIIDTFVGKDEAKSDIERTVLALVYGLPILILTIMIMYICYPIGTIAEMKYQFSHTKFIIIYSIITIIVTIVVSFFIVIYELKLSKVIHGKFRKLLGLQAIANNEQGWKEFFESSGENSKGIIILKNGKEIGKGFVRNSTIFRKDSAEIILEGSKLMEMYPECFEEYNLEYYDLVNDLVIREYKLDKLYSLMQAENKEYI